MTPTEIKGKKKEHECEKCGNLLVSVPTGFDAFSFMNPVTLRYCEYKQCSRYGVVTVASIIKEESL